ncbi:biotin carboxylase N-terminal domain-containing protein [Paractinoplanes ferrugineus]|uniref:biotin carboxylase n=1 Tax=Paractinoplanes ferrugineus TaxID=113564 RepID=A0A919MQE1_9ACTN|nr:biotin carboxylase N-terminal domain-containing protein [Actinoplanes ferrugineus]GIE16232.1 acetyl-/propionyl-CoA carboxylase subunit alpha [Actinoplanes ferrugineus]
MDKVLVANRGEIAVRIVRACRDLGVASVAVYAEPDRDALHARMADEAFLLDGPTLADTYLNIAKLLQIARRSGADAVHPGYGFLSENAEFAEAVLNHGLLWIGPPAGAIRQLGDKLAARRIAQRVGAPLVAGTPIPLADVAEAMAFAAEHGLPMALKAAHGGGGRGMRVAWTTAEIPEQFNAAVRESQAAFGRSECYAERYLVSPRHIETQCLADAYGEVQIVSTRDCSVQRRYQKLIEEAPAPFLTRAQHDEIVSASAAIIRAGGYVGAGTCEFLLAADGTISFLEVNTRLQVEHPVSEEVTGLDLVVEQLRIGAWEHITGGELTPTGHAVEFRINAEDPGRNFAPMPGPITAWTPPSGPGVRLDSGVVAGDQISGMYDSMMAKLIVKGADRAHALRRSRRALSEFTVEGLPTVLPFHRLAVEHPDFAPADPATPFSVHTRWIEENLTGALPPQDVPAGGAAGSVGTRERITVEVDGRRVEVVLPPGSPAPVVTGAAPRPPSVGRSLGRGRGAVSPAGATAGDGVLSAPMQGTVVQVPVGDGDLVKPGDPVVVLEAMKMEQPVVASLAGVISGLRARVGDTVTAGAVICEIHAVPAG